MEIKVITGEFLREPSDLAVLGCFEDLPLAEGFRPAGTGPISRAASAR